MRLGGCGIKILALKFETEMLIYHLKADLNVKILFSNFTHYIDSEIWENPEKSLFGNKDSTFHSGP